MTLDDLTAVPRTDPLLIYRQRDGLYGVDMLLTAIVHLDLFSWLADRPSSKADICHGLGIVERPADVMLTLLCAMELLEQRDGIFHLTDTAREFLVKGSPWFVGPYYEALKDRPVSVDLLRVLRTGKPANWGSQKDEKDWHTAMESDAFAKSFTAAMDSRGLYLGAVVAKAVDLSSRRHLLDIAGGSGIYACTIAAHWPELRATVLEKPPVDRIATNAIARRGCSARVSVVAGDMMSAPLPTIADVHLYSNVLHDWDEPVVQNLLKKSFGALPPGGLVMVHDAHLNAGKTGPLHVAEYSVLLMHSSEGRCYSVAEMERYLGEAGFRDVTFTTGAIARSVMTATKPGRA